jgi:hypothetical protein
MINLIWKWRNGMVMQKVMVFIVAFLFLITLSSAALSLTFLPPNSHENHEVAVSSVMFLVAPFFLGGLALSRQLSRK